MNGDSAAKEIQLKKMQEDKLHVTVELQGEVRRWRGQAEILEQKVLQLEAVSGGAGGVCVRVCMHACVRVCMLTCMRACVCTCMRAYVRACVHAYV